MIPTFHIGFCKAASTTLQGNLFGQHPGLNYVGLLADINTGRPVARDDRMESSAFEQDPLLRKFYTHLFEGNSSDARKLYQTYIREKYRTEQQPTLFSHEWMTSVLFYSKSLWFKAIALKEAIPNSKIILVVREQRKILISQYRDHPYNTVGELSEGEPQSFQQWIASQLAVPESFVHSVRYASLVKTYQNLFGKENVKVVIFERLVAEPEIVSLELMKFVGLDSLPPQFTFASKNVGLTSSNIAYRKMKRSLNKAFRINKILPEKLRRTVSSGIINSLSRIDTKPAVVNYPGFAEEAYQFYVEDNRRLSELTGLSLQDYGYSI